MGKLRKINGKWVVDFHLPRGLASKYGVSRFKRRYSKYAMAKKIHADIQSAIANNDEHGELARILRVEESEYTVESFSRRWIQEYCTPRLEVTTLKRYILSFKTINEYCGSMPLKEFRRQHLHGYIQERVLQVSPSTVNKDIIACKRMFSYAAEVGAIPSNPLIRFPSLRIQERALRIPTAEEFRALVDAMPDPALCALIAIIGEAGLRRSEAINLQWKHVDLRNARLTIEKTKGKRVRHIPLSSYAMGKLNNLIRFVHQPFVFCHQVIGERWISPDKAFRIARNKSGLNWVTLHTLRHMRATRWIQSGADIEAVREGMGHTDIQTTHRYAKHVKSTAEQVLREAQAVEVNNTEENSIKKS